MKNCTVEGCEEKHEAKGYCKNHYRRFKKYGDPLATPVRKSCSKRKPKIPYEFNHKYIDDIEYKKCSDCNKWLPMTEEYYYKNKSSKLDGFHPNCKKCVFKKYQENKEELNKKRVEHARKNREKSRDAIKKSKLKNPDKYKLHSKIWRENNPDKIREYNLIRKMHKTHDISDEEWFSCLDYFNNSCAYCGLSEKEQYEIYNESLHMEHVIHDGNNYIDNCVPSCTKCNTSKRDFDFNNWYNENNEVYSKRRYNKIINWMTKECFKVLNLR